LLATVKERQQLICAGFSADGKLFACGVGMRLNLHDAESGDWLYSLDDGDARISGIAFHPSRPLLASSVYFRTEGKIWNLTTRKAIRTLELNPTGTITFSPNGQNVVTHQNAGRDIYIRAIETGTLLAAVKLATTCDLVFAPPGEVFFTLSRSTGLVTAWSSLTGKNLYSFRAHEAGDERRRGGLAIDASGKALATYAADKLDTGEGILRLWALPARKEVASWRSKEGFCAAAFTADGRALVIGRDNGELILQEAKSGGSVRKLREPGTTVSPSVRSIHVAPDTGRMVVGCTETVELWQLAKQVPQLKKAQ
jgi:WD40 repeat protein